MRRARKRVWKLLIPSLVITDYDVYPRQRCHLPPFFAKSSFDGLAQTPPTLSREHTPTGHHNKILVFAKSTSISLPNKYLSEFMLMYIRWCIYFRLLIA